MSRAALLSVLLVVGSAVAQQPRIELKGSVGFLGDAPFRVYGRAIAGSAALQKLTLDRKPVPLTASGGFAVTLPSAAGARIVGLRVEDKAGGRAVDARTVLMGPVHAPGARLKRAIGIHLSNEVLNHPAQWVQGFKLAAGATTLHPLVKAGLERLMSAWAQLAMARLDPRLTVDLAISELRTTKHGLDIWLDVGVALPCALTSPVRGAGSPALLGQRTPVVLPSAPISAAVSLDAINQLLFAAWWGDLAARAPLNPTELPKPFGPARRVRLRPGLPALVSPASDDRFQLDLTAGEVGIEIDDRYAFSLHVRTSLAVTVPQPGRVELTVDARPRRITALASVSKAPAGVDLGNVAAVLRLGIPGGLRRLSGQQREMPGVTSVRRVGGYMVLAGGVSP